MVRNSGQPDELKLRHKTQKDVVDGSLGYISETAADTGVMTLSLVSLNPYGLTNTVALAAKYIAQGPISLHQDVNTTLKSMSLWSGS